MEASRAIREKRSASERSIPRGAGGCIDEGGGGG